MFCVFLVSNIFISYASISIEKRIALGIFGILAPFCLSFFQKKTDKKISLHSDDFPSPIPFWTIIIFSTAALFVRFWKLTTLSAWPHYDEGLWGFFALKVFQGWGWHLFYAGNPYPSAYIWILGIWFHWFNPSLLTFWLLPALFSILIIGMGYLAARQFFSKSFSFSFSLFFFAFNFWLLYMARFNSQQEPMLLWECLLLFLIGKYFQAQSSSKRQILVLFLGLVSGAGFFYFYISWAAVVPGWPE